MGTNITNVQSAVLTGMDRYRRFKEKFAERFNQPRVDAEFAAFWQIQPEAIKEIVRKNNPEMVKKFEDSFTK